MGSLTHRRYRSVHPTSLVDPAFGPVLTTPDPFVLTTRLYVAFGMRVTSFAEATNHMWGQWGTEGNRSWGWSYHGIASGKTTGRPRLAVYPTGGDASLIGPESLVEFHEVLGPLTPPVDLWVAAFVELDIGGGNRRFSYWCSRRGLHDLRSMGTITEPGATSFFNSTAALALPGIVASNAILFYELEVRETPTGPLLVDPDITRRPPGIWGSFSRPGGPNSWVGSDGRTYSLGAFASLRRSPRPRPYPA